MPYGSRLAGSGGAAVALVCGRIIPQNQDGCGGLDEGKTRAAYLGLSRLELDQPLIKVPEAFKQDGVLCHLGGHGIEFLGDSDFF